MDNYIWILTDGTAVIHVAGSWIRKHGTPKGWRRIGVYQQ